MFGPPLHKRALSPVPLFFLLGQKFLFADSRIVFFVKFWNTNLGKYTFIVFCDLGFSDHAIILR